MFPGNQGNIIESFYSRERERERERCIERQTESRQSGNREEITFADFSSPSPLIRIGDDSGFLPENVVIIFLLHQPKFPEAFEMPLNGRGGEEEGFHW